jgi:peptidoglycan hydrolase CwlO-like protein
VVPDAEEPRWAPFETVHISVNTRETLALRDARPPAPAKRAAGAPLIKTPDQFSAKEAQMGSPATPSSQDLQLQIRELTNSNLELRERIDEQTKRMKELTEEMERLSQELEKTKSKRPPARKTPSP